MPATGRAAVSSSARHTRKTNQLTLEHHHDRREKTKSSPSYVQRPFNRESLSSYSTQGGNADPSQVLQRPFKSRAHSAPQVPKSSHLPGSPEGGIAGAADNDDASFDDELSDDDEAIADDPFFQRFDMPQADRQNEQRGSFLSHSDMEEDLEGPLSPTSTTMRARPDSTAEPLQSPLSPHSPSTVRSQSILQLRI
jgi:hypothetical protein